MHDLEGDLSVTPIEDRAIALSDTRLRDRARELVFDGWKAAVYQACDCHRSVDELEGMLDLDGVSTNRLCNFLWWAVEQRLMIQRNDRFLALAIHRPARLHSAGPRRVVVPLALSVAST
jgi:hypothetical protein